MKTKKVILILAIILLHSTLHLTHYTIEAYATSKGNDPVAYWRFDEGGGPTAYDDIGTNDGTLTGDANFVNGKIGKAMEFDGTGDYVTMGNVFGGYTKLTLCAWIKPDALSGVRFIIGKSRYPEHTYGYGIVLDGAVLRGVSAYGSPATDFYNNLTYDISGTDGQWTHVAVSFDNDTDEGKLYVNGDLKDSYTSTEMSLTGGSYYFTVGAAVRSTDQAYYFDGLIDDAKIYNYIRTAAQLMVDYNAGMASHIGTGIDPNEGNAPFAYYDFEKLGDVAASIGYDKSGNGYNGTITGAIQVAGKYGSALSFDGSDDNVSCGDIDLTTAGTVSVWFKRTASSGDALDTIIDKAVHSAGSAWALWLQPNGSLYVRFYDGSGATNWNSNDTRATDGAWHHVVFKWGSSGKEVYYDGSSVFTESDSSAITANDGPVMIGDSNNRDYRFEGLIDEVKIYNYARTQAQVAYDYNKGAPVAHYKFDEGTGSIAHNAESSANSGAAPVGWWRMDNDWTDASGNGNNGTAGGSVAFSSSSKIGPYCGSFASATSDYVNCGNDDSLNFTTNDFTLETWVKKETGANILLRKGGGYSTSAPGYSIAGGSSLQISGTSKVIYNSNPGGTLATGAWNHLAYSVDRDGYVKKYINGVLTGQADISADADVSITNSSILYLSNPGQYWNGLIDDARIYDYARTAEQIYNDYKSTHGTMVADTKFVDGKLGKALSFDGTGDYVLVPGGGLSSNPMTVALWIKREVGSNDEVLLMTKDGWSDTHGIEIWIDSDDYEMGVRGSGGTIAHTNTRFDTGSWVHAVIVFNGTTVTIYKDGSAVPMVASTIEQVATSSDDAYIGRYGADQSSAYFTGQIDDVRIYNYARTAAQVMTDYNAGTAFHPGGGTGEKDPWSGDLPVAHWKFDENTGILSRDASENNYDGTINGNPTWTQGKHGPCLNFDGSGDYVDVPDSVSIQPSMSVILWAKSNTATYNAYGWLAGFRGANGFIIHPNVDTKGWGGYFHNSSGTFNNIGTYTFSDITTWHQYGIIYDDSANKAYMIVDGRFVVTTSMDITRVADTIPIDIGRDYNYGSDRWGNGLIDDVRIYDYALTQAQASWLYNKGKPVAHWRMDSAADSSSADGDTAYDDSDNNSDGTGDNGANDAGLTWETGKFGGAIDFDGTDDLVTVTHDASMNVTTAYTVAGWVKPTNTSNIGFPINKVSDDWTDGFALQQYNAGLYWYINGTTSKIADADFFSDTSWVHFEITQDGTALKLYKNGALQTSNSNGIDIDSSYNVKIGAKNTGTLTNYFDGLIDDLRMYNYARTAEQMMMDFNQGLAAKLGD
ncbi:MAG: LamG domain-containing protein [Candidatus Gorgyraea atricola]|nr:LamG domain-containing protein [Candidatus Gorgyraea atricola]